MPFALVHGTRIRYREAGGGAPTPPLLFVHGAGMSSAVWIDPLRRLARVRRGVAIDLPGHGRSGGRVTTVEEMRDALGATAAALCLGPSVLVGHSLGGLVALAAALAWPEQVAGLILVTTAAHQGPTEVLVDDLERNFARWPERFAELAYSPATPEETRRRGATLACQADLAQTALDYRALGACDLRARLGQVRARTLVVSGADDRLDPPARGAALAAGIPDATHVILDRCGHMPMDEQPELLAEAVRAFLAPVGARTK